jgi:MYXO-CTERM domain-containing protein
MIRIAGLFLLAVGLSGTALANCGNDGVNGKGCAVSMPEPSAIPELALGLVGVFGYAVWQRKRTNK